MERMSNEEWKRLDAVRRIKQAALTVVQAAQLLGVTERQVRRIIKAVSLRGTRGVVHGNTGRATWNRLGDATRDRVVKLMKGKYAGFNDQHFTEKLREVEHIQMGADLLRRRESA
jgi:predicted transcriptional regulator